MSYYFLCLQHDDGISVRERSAEIDLNFLLSKKVKFLQCQINFLSDTFPIKFLFISLEKYSRNFKCCAAQLVPTVHIEMPKDHLNSNLEHIRSASKIDTAAREILEPYVCGLKDDDVASCGCTFTSSDY